MVEERRNQSINQFYKYYYLQTAVRGIDQDTIVAKYMEYLMPDIMPCADELHVSNEGDRFFFFHTKELGSSTHIWKLLRFHFISSY